MKNKLIVLSLALLGSMQTVAMATARRKNNIYVNPVEKLMPSEYMQAPENIAYDPQAKVWTFQKGDTSAKLADKFVIERFGSDYRDQLLKKIKPNQHQYITLDQGKTAAAVVATVVIAGSVVAYKKGYCNKIAAKIKSMFGKATTVATTQTAVVQPAITITDNKAFRSTATRKHHISKTQRRTNHPRR